MDFNILRGTLMLTIHDFFKEVSLVDIKKIIFLLQILNDLAEFIKKIIKFHNCVLIACLHQC